MIGVELGSAGGLRIGGRLHTRWLEGLLAVVGIQPVQVMGYEHKQLLVELPTPEDVENFVPDFATIKQLAYPDLILTAACDCVKYDFISRFFSPKTGINEDPVTGMAHCVLGPYWATKLEKTKFHAYQASKRGGEVWVRLGTDRTYVGGKAITVAAGELLHQRD